ncbi:Peroxiredoxin [Chitinophaga sp. YR627]|uniref:TlpA family protein disulfide reductase n=1 Tax=Chitinophaga sp. YR627 TaxID=1881041 RepID=UPI0008F2D75C|nr:TlpA disulfide reductase family protein [Chitinophaga sp. YR627]SFM87439.1 Peroxiredoxin [Chitinophaga sp. YR627]
MKPIVCFLMILICPGLLFAQKNFKVSFVVPDSTILKNLSFSYYDHKTRENVSLTPVYEKNKATITHSYNTVYAHIRVELVSGDSWPATTIFATEKPATVTFPEHIDKADPFGTYTLTNAENPRQEFQAADEYVKEVKDLYLQLYDSLAPNWKPADSLDYKRLTTAKLAVDYKRLEYISSHANAYSSFVLFEKYNSTLLPPELLSERFNAIFPASFRNSDEGASVKKYLQDRVALEEKKKAISFITKDIDNNQLALKEVYNKKNVLLVFWGTWCGGCIEEIPTLREIRQQCPREQLEMISIASRSPVEKVREFIKDKQMDWKHVVNDEKIPLLYQIHGYPEVFLIDTKGNIIYKYSDYPDLHLAGLRKMLAGMAGKQ